MELLGTPLNVRVHREHLPSPGRQKAGQLHCENSAAYSAPGAMQGEDRAAGRF